MAPNNMNSSDQIEGANVRGQSQNNQPQIDIELEDEMADSEHFIDILCVLFGKLIVQYNFCLNIVP